MWTENAFAYPFWQRYLTVFCQVNIIARVAPVAKAQAHWHRVDGEKVNFYPLPYYVGLYAFLLTLPKLLKALWLRRKHQHAVIFRIPGVLSLLYRIFAMPWHKPYGAEVVGDPEDTFSSNASNSRLRPLLRNAFVKMLAWQCRHASAIAYVTQYALQAKYPPAANAFQSHYSSIQLTEHDYHQRMAYPLANNIQLLCIGNLSQPYKGCDFMLNTLAQLRSNGVDAQLIWIGGGQLLPQMQQLTDDLAISEAVSFIGNVSDRADIHRYLDQCDIFVLSSRQEGLPRVVIEAMARSVICLATNVGGVNELLPVDKIIERDNITQLTDKIQQVVHMTEQQRLSASQQNYQKALAYGDEQLSTRRHAMYQALLSAEQGPN
ncbi:glycosyltransferase [Thalassotalea sp. G2M2-11]|uniref:glycosyltransferase n=1 Tax=Thalassotalea sp. G2M2-11 TaxID=2787627 RepID=UPI001F4955E1|nr:glycosyltransferase [Thalassotalea sp. G2M2-11]